MASVSGNAFDTVPPEAVMLKGYDPPFAVLAVVIVIVLVVGAEPLTVAGAKVAVTPVGSPLVPSVIVEVIPFCGVMVTGHVIEAPFAMPIGSVGPFNWNVPARTVKLKLDVALCVPAVPVTVTL
jgi:hypothetical protein